MKSRDPRQLVSTHDIALPEWGPYSKRYIGISHVADRERGLRFDLSLFPGLYRRACKLPNVRTESGYHPWEASEDLRFVKHRHELLWKDRLYADITYRSLPGADQDSRDQFRLVEIEAVNNGEVPENLVFHFMANLNYPREFPHARFSLPPGMERIAPLDYTFIDYRQGAHDRHLQPDGRLLGEVPAPGSRDGLVLGLTSGEPARLIWPLPKSPEDTGHTVKNAVKAAFGENRCLIRYRADAPVRITPLGNSAPCKTATAPPASKTASDTTELPPSGEWRFAQIPLYPSAGTFEMPETTPGREFCWEIHPEGEFLLDGIFYQTSSPSGESDPLPLPEVEEYLPETRPELKEVGPRGLVLSYPGLSESYGLCWPDEISAEIRTFKTDTLDELFRETLHEHVAREFVQPGGGFNCFTNIFLRPLALGAGERRTLQAMVCTGTANQVERELLAFQKRTDGQNPPQKAETPNNPLQGDIRGEHFAQLLPGGEAYRFSQERMAATTLTNIVFPIRTRGQHIRHYTPGAGGTPSTPGTRDASVRVSWNSPPGGPWRISTPT